MILDKEIESEIIYEDEKILIDLLNSVISSKSIKSEKVLYFKKCLTGLNLV